MNIGRGAGFAFLLTSISFAQQIGSVDLTLPFKHANIVEKTPNGCKKLTNRMAADARMQPDGHAPERIVVQVISIDDLTPFLGSEVRARVQLRNSDDRPIIIPWITDYSAIQNTQSPTSQQWNVGAFEFRLKNNETSVLLKSLTRPVFGSNVSPGTQLTLAPGESVTATVKVKLQEEYPVSPIRLKAGEWELLVKWRLTGRSWEVKHCAVSNSYVHDDEFYHQENLGLPIRVLASGTSTSPNSSE